MKNSRTLLAACLLAVSCSKVKRFEEKTDSMEKSTQLMSATTDDMKQTTTTMYEQIRSKESEDTRNKKFTILNDEGQDLGSKMAAAAVYFKSFEFQLWSGEGNDDARARDALYLDAANEFTRRLVDVYENINLKKMSPTRSGKRHNDEKTFYALASTIHFNHHFQEALVVKRPDIKLVSFYDIVKNALRKDKNGESLTDYEEILVSGENKEIMINLIKARVDILSALALKQLTDKSKMSLGEKGKGFLFQLTGGKIGAIDLPETYDSSNQSTKNRAEKYLDGANKAKNFLAEIGEIKSLEKTLKSAFGNIDLNANKNEDSASDTQKTTIRNLVENLLK